MTIGEKLRLVMAAVLMVCVGLVASALYSVGRITSELEVSAGLTAEKLSLAGDAKAAANIMRTGQRGILLNAFQHDTAGAQATIRDYNNKKQNAMELVAKIEASAARGESRDLVERLKSAIEAHAESFRRVAELCEEGKLKEAAAYYKQSGAPAGVAMERAATDLMARQTAMMRESAVAGRRQARFATLAMSTIGAGGLGVLLATAFVVAGITKVLSGLSADLNEGAAQVRSASGQVAVSSQKLAQEASQVASGIEETSAAAQQVAGSARKSADQARSAANLMDTVDARVSDGNKTLREMVASMSAITESSARISKIIQVIDEIAFQTNILALNAAVEAARAGTAGMGFAVVADEVRTLAQRSAGAARDTAALIEDSIAKSNDGSVKLERVSEVIRGITENTGSAKTLIDAVSVACLEEAKDVDQISRGVSQMQEAAQQTASFSEQSAAASQQLSAQAKELDRIAHQMGAMVRNTTRE